MFFKRFFVISIFFLFSFSSVVSADEGEYYQLDEKHTQILFFVDHLGFSKSEGEFLKFEGGFYFNENDPERSKVHVIIDANSLTMDYPKWTNHVKNADFLDVPEYQKIEFKSHSVSVRGDRYAEVTGDLTLRGVTKPLTLYVTYNKSGLHPYSKKYIAGFSATATLKRSDFGMTYGLPGIGDEVEIRLEVEGIKK